MNIIEAHQIVNLYIDAIAKCPIGCTLLPASSLPFYSADWKYRLMDASKLYSSYVILWGTWTQEQIEKYLDSLTQIDCFVPDIKVQALTEAMELKAKYNNIDPHFEKLYAKKLEKAEKTIQQLMLEQGEYNKEGIRRKAEVIKVINQMLSYKTNYFDSQQKEGENLYYLIEQYCQETYRVAGVKLDEKDSFYFYLLSQCGDFTNAEIKLG